MFALVRSLSTFSSAASARFELVFFLLIAQFALYSRGPQRVTMIALLVMVVCPRVFSGRWRYEVYSWRDGAVRYGSFYGCFAFIIAAHFLGMLHRDVYYEKPDELFASKFFYILSAQVQWLVIYRFIRPVIGEAFGEDNYADHYTAVVFAFCHNPNLPLMVLCYGACWYGLLRARAFGGTLSVGLAHAIIGITVTIAVPAQLMCLHVGHGFVSHHHVPYKDPIHGWDMPPGTGLMRGIDPPPTPSWLR